VLEEETSDLLEHYGETRDFLFNGIKSLGNLQFEEKKSTGVEGIDPTPYFHGKPPPRDGSSPDPAGARAFFYINAGSFITTQGFRDFMS